MKGRFANLLRASWLKADSSLRTRLFLPTAFLATTALVLMVAVSVGFYSRDLRREQEEQALLFASLATQAVQTFASQYQHDDLSGVLGALQQHRRGLDALSIVRANGQVSSSSRRELVGSATESPVGKSLGIASPRPGESGFSVLSAMYHAERCGGCHGDDPSATGWIELRFSDEALREARRQLAGTLALAALPSLVLLLGVSWFLGGHAVRPLQRLVHAMRRAEAGDKEVHADEGRRDEIGMVARGFDATLAALRKSQAELERAYEERMIRADRFAMVGQMATGLAHEIRNPLAGLSGALELLAEDLADNPYRSEIVSEMRHQVARLSKIMDELISFARPPKAQLQSTDINSALNKVLFLVSKQRRTAAVQVLPLLAPELPRVRADPAQVEQVFLNICLNAFQILAEKGGTLTVRSSARDGAVVVEISDTGPGIPPEIRPQIFMPFFTTRANGTGLGLAISSRIISEHGGKIWFHCPPEGGTTFTVMLPIESSNAPTDVSPTPSPATNR